MAAKREKSHSKVVPEVVAGERAIKYVELVTRAESLMAESRRIHDELKVVTAEKAEMLRLLTAGMSSDAPATKDDEDDKKDDKKESVYRLVVAKPSHIFPTAEVIKALGMNQSTASVYLSKLANGGRITRVSKGKYQALQPGGQPTATRPATAKEYVIGAMPDRVLALLNSEPETIFVAQEIISRFGLDETNLNAVRNACSRLARDTKIKKVSHGKYQALPGRGKM
jgi:predicted transcriptional regulator of viral defense system